MPPSDALTFGALVVIFAVMVLWQQPVCPHGCATCAEEATRRRREKP